MNEVRTDFVGYSLALSNIHAAWAERNYLGYLRAIGSFSVQARREYQQILRRHLFVYEGCKT